MSLEDRVFGISGGATGIGLATAQIIAKRGGALCIGDVNPTALKKAEAYFSAEKVPFSATKLGVSDKSQVSS